MIIYDVYYSPPRGVMYILLLGSCCFLFLNFSWPRMVTRAIQRKDGAGEEWGGKVFPSAIVWVILFWVVLVFSGKHSWQDSEPVITAAAIVAAIFFSYGKVLPPSFYAAYLKVTNYESGEFDRNRKLGALTIEKGKWWPVVFVVYNTGIIRWDNHRITVDLPDGLMASEEIEEFPNCRSWSYTPERESLKIGRQPNVLQKRSTNIFAIGETSITRFFVKADKSGRFELKVMVTTSGSLSERHQWLSLNVND